MKLIHLFWQQTSNDFNNTGCLYLWLEQANKLDHKIKKNKKYYPYQANDNTLASWFREHFARFLPVKKQTLNKKISDDATIEQLSTQLPCDEAKQPIPSPIIANLNNLEFGEYVELAVFTLNAIKIDQPLAFLKELNFQSYYFEDDLQLADDAIFWLKMGTELSQVIKQDQYIPFLIAQKVRRQTEFHSKWQPLSADYQQRLQQIAPLMPFSACLPNHTLLLDSVELDPITVLQHFSEVVLNHIISCTSYPNTVYKQLQGSFIESNISLGLAQPRITEPQITQQDWKSWQLWHNNLHYDQFGSPFQLCFRLNEATSSNGVDWGLEVLLQAKVDPSFMIDIAEFWQDKSSKKTFFSKMFGTSIERNLLLQLGYACRIYPLLEQVFEQNMRQKLIILTTDQAFGFLKEDAWALQACGYNISVPSWWTASGRLKAKIKMRGSKRSRSGESLGDSSGSGAVPSYLSQDGLIDFNYSYAIGEIEVSNEEWQQLIESKSELMYFRGEWMQLDPAEMAKMQKLIESSQQDKNSGGLKDLLSMAANEEQYSIELDDAINEMMLSLKDKEKLALIAQPENLNANLRPYQVRGLSWLSYLENLGMNPCLADDMGLGKTMQVISLFLNAPKQQAALIIAPTSVIGNWYKELEKFAPSIKAIIHHGSKRTKHDEFSHIMAENDIVITSYGLIRKDKGLFKSVTWSRLIIDEAQNIKNPAAEQTKVISSIKANSRIALTGTPIENRLMDLWSIFNFLNPGILGTRTAFRKEFEIPIQRDNDIRKTKILKNLVEPFILRRLKTDKNIIQDLPDKIEQKVYCELTKEQASLYQSIVNEVEQSINETEELSAHKMIFLSALLRLKQCCNHPAQLLQDGSEFSLERSIKLQRLTELVKEAINNGESLLIFSQFKEICDALQNLLKTQLGYNIHYLHGGTSRKKREQMIEQFQASDSPPSIFVLSLKAGGVGITLTKANHVIHFDRWWNPAVENQATDRAYRIGQQKTVFAHKFITLGTVEEKIDQMLEDKQKVADSIIGNDESWLSTLNAKSFIKLIQLRQQG
ncbi:MAG: DEAD/DEAH box helicase [Alteromonadaceae bacterium]|nr:DEAD/DEAH box helicase [Alteromonadaceae bacterium]